MQAFAVSIVSMSGDNIVHELRIIQAKSGDHAEAHVIATALKAGRQLIGAQSLPANSAD